MLLSLAQCFETSLTAMLTAACASLVRCVSLLAAVKFAEACRRPSTQGRVSGATISRWCDLPSVYKHMSDAQ